MSPSNEGQGNPHTSAKRVDSLKDVPTLQEQGLKGFEVGIWHALYAPKGTPKPVMDKLSAALQTALKDQDVIKRFADLGATTYPPEKGTAAALQAHLKSETEKWGPIIKAAGLDLTIGVARVRPENRTRGWIAMRWRP